MPCFYFCIYGVKCICVDVTAQGNKRYTSLYWPRNIAMAQWQERGGSAVSSHSNPGSLHRIDVSVMTAHWAKICEHKTGTLSYNSIREDTAFIEIILQQDITNSVRCAFYSEQRPNESNPAVAYLTPCLSRLCCVKANRESRDGVNV